MSRDESLPSYGQIWDLAGRLVCVLGDGAAIVSLDSKMWVKDWGTGATIMSRVGDLRPVELTEQNCHDQVVSKCIAWAREGDADAAWWLGWLFEGVNQPKAVWYQIAAVRRAPKRYEDYLSNIASNGAFGCMCPGVPQPDIRFMHSIVEIDRIGLPLLAPSKDWASAIANAEAGVHTASTDEQIEEAIRLFASGQSLRQSAWNAGLTEQALCQAGEFKTFREAFAAGEEAFRSIAGALSDHLREGKSARRKPRCPYRIEAKRSAWEFGYAQAHDEFMEAWTAEET